MVEQLHETGMSHLVDPGEKQIQYSHSGPARNLGGVYSYHFRQKIEALSLTQIEANSVL